VSATEPPPPRGLVAIGAAGLSMEALVMWLSAPGIATLDRGHVSAIGIGYVVGVGVLLVAAAAVMRRPWGRTVGTAVQLPAVATGVVAWPMYVVAAVFAAIWIYYLRLLRLP
jgi:uncharacterized membrane protein YidH (DUF202 family)